MDQSYREQEAKARSPFEAGLAPAPLAPLRRASDTTADSEPPSARLPPGPYISPDIRTPSTESAVSLFGGMYDGASPKVSSGDFLVSDAEYQIVAGRIHAAEQGSATPNPLAPAKEQDGKAPPAKRPGAADMSGIGSTLAVGHFVSVAKRVHADWGKLTPEARANGLVSAANDELAAAGVPRVEKTLMDLGGRAGEFTSEFWQMKLGQGPFGRLEIGEGEAGSLADTVYHEARHAEQTHRMARLLAGQGKRPEAIAVELDIPKFVAGIARDAPLDGKTAEGKEAQSYYDSQYGKDIAHSGEMDRPFRSKWTAGSDPNGPWIPVQLDQAHP